MVIQGDLGDVRTTMVLAIAAVITTDKALPESKVSTEPMNVIFQTAEYGLGDTVKPRLAQSGSDCQHFIVIAMVCNIVNVSKFQTLDKKQREFQLKNLRNKVYQ